MTKIPIYDREIIEQAVYLPMLLTVLNRDLQIVKQSKLKFKQPYEDLIEETMKIIQNELEDIKQYMYKHSIKVERIKSDDAFTMYIFLYKGNEELHNYFNLRLRNRTEELLHDYMYKRFKQKRIEKEA